MYILQTTLNFTNNIKHDCQKSYCTYQLSRSIFSVMVLNSMTLCNFCSAESTSNCSNFFRAFSCSLTFSICDTESSLKLQNYNVISNLLQSNLTKIFFIKLIYLSTYTSFGISTSDVFLIFFINSSSLFMQLTMSFIRISKFEFCSSDIFCNSNN